MRALPGFACRRWWTGLLQNAAVGGTIRHVWAQVMVEVSGCPTTCVHCWAVGRGYRAMPLDDAAFFLEELASFCGERGLAYTAWPMHEVTAHPAAPDMIRLFAPHLGEAYDPMLTPGTPLATRADWEEVIAAARECGAHALWVAFHGYGAEHDRQLNRPGAFEETCLAVRRAQDCGLGTGANVFLTKLALPGFDRLLSTFLDLGLAQLWIAPAIYTPTPRGRRYEALRPELGELLLIARRVLDASLLLRDQWSDLESYTEAAWVRRALDGTWLTSDGDSEERYRLVCRPNLDLYTGTTGIYFRRHGNMRRDGARTVLERALADGPFSHEQLYFPDSRTSPNAGLAGLVGNPDGTRVYFEAVSVRDRWLDLATGKARQVSEPAH